MTEEEWRPAAGYEGLYEVSDQGRVRNAVTSRVRRPFTHEYGYAVYPLYKGQEVHNRYAHRLVAEAFLGERTGPLVRHLDGDPKNNTVGNLAWGDTRDNIADARRHGTWPALLRNQITHCRAGHEFTESNSYFVPGSGKRKCRTCRRAAAGRYKARRANTAIGKGEGSWG